MKYSFSNSSSFCERMRLGRSYFSAAQRADCQEVQGLQRSVAFPLLEEETSVEL